MASEKCSLTGTKTKKLNSPNDVVVKSDGSIWFTDPTYGIDSDYEGDSAESEIGASYVYRLSTDGKLEAVIRDIWGAPTGWHFRQMKQLSMSQIQVSPMSGWNALQISGPTQFLGTA
ncbi:MAG: hypothetical protein Ct9H300mP26_4980 [Acidimicrobiales bacterium]|nr:MAG: hypothetical protein Ct9H300mP26_4980 [Acidimicrobiales bacterium]